MKYLFIWLFLFCIPAVTQAAIVINEVAWMGTTVSANDEWIELYNNGGSSEDVGGWVLTDGMNLNIPLTGNIAPSQYAVLERTDDTSAPGIMFLKYSGVLVNTGATLSLYRADNSLEDRVVGGADWGNIGGDNTTKETAQYTAGGWVAAVSTPGYVNASEAVSVQEDSMDTADTDGASSQEAPSTVPSLHTAPRTLRVSVDVPGRVYVNQEISAEAIALGLADGILNALTHEWNFGDFTTIAGKETVHRFEYPGEYVVTLHSQYKDYQAYARQTITVLPVSFSLTTNTHGDVQVHNDARYEVDVSGYKIAAGKTLQFPKGTILLPNATITIPKEKLQYTHNATLFDDTATQVASIIPVPQQKREVVMEEVSPVSTLVAYAPLIEVPKIENPNFTFVEESEEEKVVVPTSSLPKVANTGQMAAPIEAAGQVPDGKLPYFALLAVIGLGVTAVFAGRAKG